MKSAFDIVFVILTLPITLPIILVISILIAVLDGRPVFFLQLRSGQHMKPFKIIKFRTMTNMSRNGEFCQSQVTRLGSFLRKTSLDEIPSIINILLGQMSLVGPRPYLHSYIDGYTEKQKERFEFKPGLSGLLQIKQRNNCTWSTKFRYDQIYKNNVGFWFDMYIIMQTVKVVLVPPKNISGKGSTLFYKSNK